MQRLTTFSVTSAYRDWLLDEAQREADSDCARLRRVLDEQTAFFLEQTAGWPAEQVATLMRGHIKRGWRKEVPPLNLTAEEQQAYPTFEWPILSPDAVSRTKVVWELRRRYMAGAFKIDAESLHQQVSDRLDVALGKGSLNGGVLRYETRVAGVTVLTNIDLLPKGTAQLRYSYSVLSSTADDRVGTFDPRILLKDASPFDLLGGPQATWSCLTSADIPAAVEALADFSLESLDIVTKIIQAAKR
jgi:hypothetical protein